VGWVFARQPAASESAFSGAAIPVKSRSHRVRSSNSRGHNRGQNKPKHAPYTTRDTVQLPGGAEVTLEIGPPVASDASERWGVLADAALHVPTPPRMPKPDPKRDRERWLKALSHDGRDGSDRDSGHDHKPKRGSR